MTDEPRAEHVVEAIARVMRDMPAIGKDDRASDQQGGYSYRGIEKITAAAAPLLAKHGVVIVPNVVTWTRDEITVGNNKIWHDDRLMVTYTIYGPAGIEDRIEAGPIACIGRDGADKGTNKALTQAYKYLLLQLLCVGDRAADNDGQSTEQDASEGPLRASDDDVAEIEEQMAALDDAQRHRLKDWWKVRRYGSLHPKNPYRKLAAQDVEPILDEIAQLIAEREENERAMREAAVS